MRPPSATAATRSLELGARIRKARKARGLTQRELAERVAVGRRMVQFWESGKAGVTWGKVALLTEALDCSEDWLLMGEAIEEIPGATPPFDPDVGTGGIVAALERLEGQIEALRDEHARDFDELRDNLDRILGTFTRRTTDRLLAELGDEEDDPADDPDT